MSNTAVVTGKAVNRGNGKGMQVPFTLNFEGKKKQILFLRMSWARLTSNDKQQVNSRLHAIISVDQEELSKLFVYHHTNI